MKAHIGADADSGLVHTVRGTSGNVHLLSAMDALVDHKAEVDNVTASLLRPLVDQDLAMVFYDMTTIRAGGLSEQDGDLRLYGMAKVGVVERQVMLGGVQTSVNSLSSMRSCTWTFLINPTRRPSVGLPPLAEHRRTAT